MGVQEFNQKLSRIGVGMLAATSMAGVVLGTPKAKAQSSGQTGIEQLLMLEAHIERLEKSIEKKFSDIKYKEIGERVVKETKRESGNVIKYEDVLGLLYHNSFFRIVSKTENGLNNFIYTVNSGVLPSMVSDNPEHIEKALFVLENRKYLDFYILLKRGLNENSQFGMTDVYALKDREDLLTNEAFMRNLKMLKDRPLFYGHIFSGYLDALLHPQFSLVFTNSSSKSFPSVIALLVLAKYPSQDEYWEKLEEMMGKFSSQNEKDKAMTLVIYFNKALIQDADFRDYVVNGIRSGEILIPENLTETNVKNIMHEYTRLEIEKIAPGLSQDLNIVNFTELTAKLPDNSALKLILNEDRDKMFVWPILKMNNLHNQSDQKRLEVLKDLNARIILEILATAGSDAYLSSFKLAYNSDGKRKNFEEGGLDFVSKLKSECELLYKDFKEKSKKECGSLYSFFNQKQNGNYKLTSGEFINFVRSLSIHNQLDVFLTDLGTLEQQKEIFNTYFFSKFEKIEAKDLGTVYDLLASSSPEINKMTVSFLEAKLLSDDPETQKVATALLVKYFDDPKNYRNIPENFKSIFDKNKLTLQEKNQEISKDELWRKEIIDGKEVLVSTQLTFSYDDTTDDLGVSQSSEHWDGHRSLDNFLITNGGGLDYDKKTGVINGASVGKGWNIVNNVRLKKDGYIVLEKKVGLGVMRHVLTLPKIPKESGGGVKTKAIEIYKPQIFHHMGHSYHAYRSLDTLEKYQKFNGTVVFVNMRSCGGEKEFARINAMGIKKMFGTRNIGTMAIADPYGFGLDRKIESGKVDFVALKKEFKSNDPRYGAYIHPQDNAIVQLLTIYEKLSKV